MADYSEVFDALNDLIQFDKRLRTAASTVHNLMAQRIFASGKAQDGGDIGKYSTKPAYFNPKISPKKFTGKGKGGKTKFKNGDEHKTRYFETGYAGLRQIAGRQTSHVDLRFSGSLEASYIFSKEGITYVSGFIDNLHGEIAEGNEDRFNKLVFALTEEEEERFAELMLPADL